jgi:MHS family proline/betaine transporter-like MFS transporter
MDRQTIRGQSRAIVAGIAGNVMEWYDFSVYGYFAAIIGRNFFPAGGRTTSLIAAFGVVGLYIRSGLVEDRLAQPKTKSPVREAFQTEWRTILRLIGFNAAFAVSFYMGFVYVTTYIRQVDHIAQSTALDINTVAMLVSLVPIPLIGALSDRIGRKPILLAATGRLFVLAWPLFWMLHHPEISLVLPAQIGFAVLVACFGGTVPAAMVELVPDRVRCTVLSVGYNTGMAFLGGLTPLSRSTPSSAVNTISPRPSC